MFLFLRVYVHVFYNSTLVPRSLLIIVFNSPCFASLNGQMPEALLRLALVYKLVFGTCCICSNAIESVYVSQQFLESWYEKTRIQAGPAGYISKSAPLYRSKPRTKPPIISSFISRSLFQPSPFSNLKDPHALHFAPLQSRMRTPPIHRSQQIARAPRMSRGVGVAPAADTEEVKLLPPVAARFPFLTQDYFGVSSEFNIS